MTDIRTENPTPPTGSVEKFIGILGSNLTFIEQGQDNNPSTAHSSYDIIAKLFLKLSDPRVDRVKSAFSKLTHFMEIRSLADPDYPVPDFDQDFVVPQETQDKVNEQFKAIYSQGKKVLIDYPSFMAAFSTLLSNQGMPELAEKLNQTETPTLNVCAAP